MHGGGQAEGDEPANTYEVDVDGSLQQFGAMPAVVPEKVAHEHEGQVDAGNGGGPAGTDHAHRRGAPLAVDEYPIEKGVDEICTDESEGDGLRHVHGLQAATNSEIQQKREKAEGEGFHVRDGESRDWGLDMQTAKERGEEPDRDHQERRHDDAEINAVD